VSYSFNGSSVNDSFSGITEVVNHRRYLNNLLKEFLKILVEHNNEQKDAVIKVINIPAILCEVLWLHWIVPGFWFGVGLLL